MRKKPTKKQIVYAAKRLLGILSKIPPSELPIAARLQCRKLAQKVGSKAYFSSAWIVDLSGFQHGIEQDETGLNVSKFTIRTVTRDCNGGPKE